MVNPISSHGNTPAEFSALSRRSPCQSSVPEPDTQPNFQRLLSQALSKDSERTAGVADTAASLARTTAADLVQFHNHNHNLSDQRTNLALRAMEQSREQILDAVNEVRQMRM